MTVEDIAHEIEQLVKDAREIGLAELVAQLGPAALGDCQMADQTGSVFVKDVSAAFVQAFNLACVSGDSHIRIWRCPDGQHFTATYIP